MRLAIHVVNTPALARYSAIPEHPHPRHKTCLPFRAVMAKPDFGSEYMRSESPGLVELPVQAEKNCPEPAPAVSGFDLRTLDGVEVRA
jgi:hypothetical protein